VKKWRTVGGGEHNVLEENRKQAAAKKRRTGALMTVLKETLAKERKKLR